MKASSITDWIIAVLTLVYVVANVLLLCVVRGQLFAAKVSARAALRAARVAEKSLKLTQRADIMLDAAGLEDPAGRGVLGPRTRIVFVFKNFGHTRASSVLYDIHLKVPDMVPGNQLEELLPTTLGAGDTRHVAFGGFGSWLNAKTFTDIMNGKTEFTFHGEVTYTDIFGEKHHLICAGRYRAEIRNFEITRHGGD